MSFLSNWVVFCGLALIVIIIIEVYLARYLRKRTLIESYRAIMGQLHQTYLCGYSLWAMIRANFFHRFGNINKEGFCYTFSAAIMLGLKELKRTRLVRGKIVLPNYDSFHSWVEVKVFGQWWVVDPCFYSGGFTRKRWYYQKLHPEVVIIYRYQDFWKDPAANQFYERLRHPELSKVFVELYYHYTPHEDTVGIYNMEDDIYDFPNTPEYYLFPPNYGFKFTQKIINELMARPTRRSPRQRTLRCLDSYYRKRSRELAQESPA